LRARCAPKFVTKIVCCEHAKKTLFPWILLRDGADAQCSKRTAESSGHNTLCFLGKMGHFTFQSHDPALSFLLDAMPKKKCRQITGPFFLLSYLYQDYLTIVGQIDEADSDHPIYTARIRTD